MADFMGGAGRGGGVSIYYISDWAWPTIPHGKVGVVSGVWDWIWAERIGGDDEKAEVEVDGIQSRGRKEGRRGTGETEASDGRGRPR